MVHLRPFLSQQRKKQKYPSYLLLETINRVSQWHDYYFHSAFSSIIGDNENEDDEDDENEDWNDWNWKMVSWIMKLSSFYTAFCQWQRSHGLRISSVLDSEAARPQSATWKLVSICWEKLDWTLSWRIQWLTSAVARSLEWSQLTAWALWPPAAAHREHTGWPRTLLRQLTHCVTWTESSDPFQDHRRLSPAEMARLQGFRNGDIPWKVAGTPITARGSQVGNSMAVPCLQEAFRAVLTAARLIWIGRELN